MAKEELSKGFTGIEINDVRFSNIKEMLIYMNKQRVRIINLENENAELKAYNEKLLDGDIEKHNKLVEMGKENSRLKQIILGNEMEIAAKDETIEDLFETNQRLKIELDTPVYDKLDKAKELIKRLLKETYGEGWNYSLQVKVEAEKFLKESE